MSTRKSLCVRPGRRCLVLALFAIAYTVVAGRAVDLQVLNKGFLQNQAEARHLRVVKMPAHRGMILDRHGEPLAISTPIDSVWANPKQLNSVVKLHPVLAKLLDLKLESLRRLLAKQDSREFVYLRRHVDPALARQVRNAKIPGVYLQREYRRYYPAGEVMGHVVGFTNIDDAGQEGMELAYDEWLQGRSGAKRVLIDGHRHVVKDVESIRTRRPGRELVLTIDRRIQYLAYRELKAAVQAHRARSGSVVTLDVRTGEILAVVNQPSYNPNNRHRKKSAAVRNRAITDVFEPGSALKPLTIAYALESGHYSPNTPIDTSPGILAVGLNTVRDVRDFGVLNVSGVIQKSSNVGASKIALSMSPEGFWSLLSRVGFGTSTGSSFPGEAAGLLTHFESWDDIELATLSFGYGLSVTCLQLAQSYAMLAADGRRRPVSFVRQENIPVGERIISATSAQQVRAMLELAVGEGGTGKRAQIPGYRVAGKTGTVRKAVDGGYAGDRYSAIFAGLAPASNPRLVTVVVIHEPSNGQYYGGQVAAPVFSRVMAGALRLMNIAPDRVVPQVPTQLHASLGNPA
ncbi:MAG: penicillin-binding transpeptidase domain-containing protein [Gammaproteobacteria bacterium]